MTIKLFQLNIFKGLFLSEIIEYVKQNDFDIIHFQEVSGGSLSNGGLHMYPSYMDHKSDENETENTEVLGVDLFAAIKERLGSKYGGQKIDTYKHTTDPNSYFANATFYKQEFLPIKIDKIEMKPFNEIDPDFRDWQHVGRGALAIEFEKDETRFLTVNGHFAWGPNPQDEDYKIEQAKKLYEYLSHIKIPIILTGDFNVTSDTKTASMFEDFAQNITAKHKVTNTLNFNVHPAKQLFPPGLAVDFIFTSPEITVKDFQLVDSPDLSDHYGLKVEIEI